MGTRKINPKYIPKSLTKKDKSAQTKMLLKSRRMYKRGKFYTRKPVSSYKSRKSKHIRHAQRIYGVNVIGATKELAKKSGCSKAALAKIINKGEGAYYSSGSRPNQTPQSWGIARLASALTSGKAATIDYDILYKGCKKGSLGFKSAQKSRKLHNNILKT